MGKQQFLGWTEDLVKQKVEEKKIRGYTDLKKKNAHKTEKNILKTNKYNNQKTKVEDVEFDSKKEAKRYKELKLLLKAGSIGQLARQVEYELNVGGSHSLVYKADFVYIDAGNGKTIVEDVKGLMTREYKKKKKLMKQIHKIKIVEI